MGNIYDYKPGKRMFQQDVTIRLGDLMPRQYANATDFTSQQDDHATLSDALVAINSLRSQVQLLGETPVL